MSFSGGGQRRGLGTAVGFVRWNREMQNNVPAMDTRAINEQAASEVYMYGSFVLRNSGAFGKFEGQEGNQKPHFWGRWRGRAMGMKVLAESKISSLRPRQTDRLLRNL